MTYTFDPTWQKERERLAKIEVVFDDTTIHVLEAVGVRDGSCCLDVGAGGGSIAQWLCYRVGPTGHVVATDIQTKFLDAIQLPHLEVRQHDIVKDSLEQDTFDFVHSRAVLQHLPARDVALARMVAALKPGGWLVVQAGDFSAVTLTSDRGAGIFTHFLSAWEAYFVAKGFAWSYGTQMGIALRQHGLTDVRLEGHICEWGGGDPLTQFWDLSVQQVREPLVQTGTLTSDAIDAFLTLIRSPDFRALSQIACIAYGRKPT